MYCPYCGTQTEQGTLFCPACGKEIRSFFAGECKKTVGTEGVQGDSSLEFFSAQAGKALRSNAVISNEEHKKKLRSYTCLEAVSAVLVMIAILLLIFVPLFVNEYTEMLDGERVAKEETFSLFALCYATLKMLITGDFSAEYLILFGMVRLLITLWSVMLVYITGKDAVQKIIRTVKFEEYYHSELLKNEENEQTREILKRLKLNRLDNLYHYVFSELLLVFVVGGYDKLFVAGFVFVGLIMIAGFVLGSFVKKARKRLTKEIKGN